MESKKILGLFRPKFGSQAVYDEPSANKITQTNRAGVTDADYSLTKIILVMVIVAFLALLFGYSLSAWGAFLSIVTGMIFISSLALVPLLIKAPGLYFLVSVISSAAIVIPLSIFRDISLTPSLIFAMISAILLVSGIIFGKQELDNSLRTSFTKFTRPIITKAFIVIALAFAISYGWGFRAEDLSADWFIDGAIFISSPIMHYYVPGFTPDMELSEFLSTLARGVLARENTANFILMPEPAKRELIDKTVENMHLMIKDGFTINMNLDSSFKDNFRKAMIAKVSTPAQSIHPNHIVVIAAIIIFILTRGVLWLFSWLIILFTFFVFQLLLATKFAEVYLESRSKEIVVLK